MIGIKMQTFKRSTSFAVVAMLALAFVFVAEANNPTIIAGCYAYAWEIYDEYEFGWESYHEGTVDPDGLGGYIYLVSDAKVWITGSPNMTVVDNTTVLRVEDPYSWNYVLRVWDGSYTNTSFLYISSETAVEFGAGWDTDNDTHSAS